MAAIESARIVFAGTPEFAVPCLEALVSCGATPALVLTQPDRPAGRGRRLTASAIKQAAGRLDIPVVQPVALEDPALTDTLGSKPELLVVVAYGLILPRWLLDWPSVAPVNVHASLLPRWRGAAPIQHAILAGDGETGVTIMRMTTGLDRGPIYAQRATPIDIDDTAASLHDRLSRLGAGLLIDTLPGIADGSAAAVPQDGAAATYAGKIDKRDALLRWSESAAMLARRVRAYNPWPIAEARLCGGGRLRIWAAEAIESAGGAAPGTIVAASGDGIDVATSDGVLRLLEIQAPGSRRMSAGAYLAAHDLGGSGFEDV